jgi:hypothetical protein
MLEQIDQMKSKLLMCIEGRRVKYVSDVFGIIILHTRLMEEVSPNSYKTPSQYCMLLDPGYGVLCFQNPSIHLGQTRPAYGKTV